MIINLKLLSEKKIAIIHITLMHSDAFYWFTRRLMALNELKFEIC